jgi:phage baseplate assembly protein W
MAALVFPFTVDDAGAVGLVRDEVREARNEIVNCLMTTKRERPMRPMYGGDVHSFLFDVIDDDTVGEMKVVMGTALADDVPTVRITGLDVTPSSLGESTLEVVVYFSLAQDIDGETYAATITIDGVVTERVL